MDLVIFREVLREEGSNTQFQGNQSLGWSICMIGKVENMDKSVLKATSASEEPENLEFKEVRACSGAMVWLKFLMKQLETIGKVQEAFELLRGIHLLDASIS